MGRWCGGRRCLGPYMMAQRGRAVNRTRAVHCCRLDSEARECPLAHDHRVTSPLVLVTASATLCCHQRTRGDGPSTAPDQHGRDDHGGASGAREPQGGLQLRHGQIENAELVAELWGRNQTRSMSPLSASSL